MPGMTARPASSHQSGIHSLLACQQIERGCSDFSREPAHRDGLGICRFGDRARGTGTLSSLSPDMIYLIL